MKSYFLLGGAALALAACNSDTAPEGDQAAAQGGAQGEVLGGTISDAMIPLDTVTSQSPPLKIEASPGDGEGGNAAASGNDGAASDAEAEQATETEASTDTAETAEEEAGE